MLTRLRQLRARLLFRCSAHPTVVFYDSAAVANSQSRDAITIGRHTHVRGELLTLGHGGGIQVGCYCYVGEQSRIWSGSNIAIGDRVLISHLVNIFDNSTHPFSPTARHEQFREIVTTGHPKHIDLGDRPITLHDDALICASSTILAGVTVGRGAIVAAGSVVTKDVPAFTIVAGNPARKVRDLSPSERE